MATKRKTKAKPKSKGKKPSKAKSAVKKAAKKKIKAKGKKITAAAKEKSRQANPDAHLASEVVKRHAGKQKMSIRLTDEQMEVIRKQWDDRDPLMPAEITFYAGRRREIGLKVAGYRYRGSSCCA